MRKTLLLRVIAKHQGKYSAAEAEYRAVLKLKEKVLGRDHPSTLRIENNLVSALTMQGKYSAAETEYRAVIALKETALGATIRKRWRLGTTWRLCSIKRVSTRKPNQKTRQSLLSKKKC